MPNIAEDNSKWTTDQDGAIIKLKKDEMSWAKIGESIGITKGLVKNRHKFLEAQIRAAGLDPAKIGESWAEDMRRQGQDLPSPEKPMSSPEKPTPVPEVEEEQEFPMMGLAGIVEEEEKEAEVEQAEKQPSPTGSGGSKTTHKAPTASPVVVQDSPRPGTIKLSGRVIEKNGVRFAEVADSSSSSSEDDSDSDDSDDSEGERAEQKRFLYHEYWSELYPKQKTYKPDRHWTEGDCKVLAVIEAKDEALKYKRMQADFFNATGRMVSEEIIKHKMQKSS